MFTSQSNSRTFARKGFKKFSFRDANRRYRLRFSLPEIRVFLEGCNQRAIVGFLQDSIPSSIDLVSIEVIPLVTKVTILLEEVAPITVSLVMLIVIDEHEKKEHLQVFVENEYHGYTTPAKKLDKDSTPLAILPRHDILSGNQPTQAIVGIGELKVPPTAGFRPNLCK